MSSSSRRDVRFSSSSDPRSSSGTSGGGRPSSSRLEVPSRDAYGRSSQSSSSRSQPSAQSSMTLPIRSSSSRPTSSSSSSSSRQSAPVPGAPAGAPPPPCTYTDDMLDYFEEENEDHVTQQHLIHASDHVINAFKKVGIRYGILGGLGMVLLGNQGRTTKDADIAVEAKVKELLGIFADDKRVYVPRASSVAGAGVARIFVLTGPAFGENVRPLAVEVDLILNGEQGTPRELSGATETLSIQTPQGRREWKVLKLKYFFKGKLKSFYNREGTNDYKDLCWMIFQHPEKVKAIAQDLDEDRLRFFADAYAERDRNPDRIKYVQEVLGLRRGSSSKSSSSRDAGGTSISRSSDPRYSDPRYQSTSGSSRSSDARYADPRYADPRYTSSSGSGSGSRSGGRRGGA
ncbi:hypothetical protein C8A03DRAFT_35473 [Achaetomium macrosporum]|uniref:Uncharacterized protein n=1 Tax=Achaetomium macrosporum TaxID=79813 RepID=A0AAN7C8C9_9PEZI|nr:hypothetical protein C8A03DRAFT_35473 [Achaetomium macrosporum]